MLSKEVGVFTETFKDLIRMPLQKKVFKLGRHKKTKIFANLHVFTTSSTTTVITSTEPVYTKYLAYSTIGSNTISLHQIANGVALEGISFDFPFESNLPHIAFNEERKLLEIVGDWHAENNFGHAFLNVSDGTSQFKLETVNDGRKYASLTYVPKDR